MKQCTPIVNKRRGVCAGNFTERVKIFIPAITAPTAGVDFTKPQTQVLETWAMVATTRGSEIFDGAALTNAYTHNFYIRYPAVSVSAVCWIEYRAENYKIADIENLDERREVLVLRCIKKGDKTKAVNSI
jgi:SPP1 family predicted phage head-tail adaptor